MAENNPYCRPSLMPRAGTSFYGGTPRAESRYDRGNLGPPIYGEYRDRWTGTEWLRGDGSRAPLAGLGDEFRAAKMAMRPGGSIPFVTDAIREAKGRLMRGEGRTTCPPGSRNEERRPGYPLFCVPCHISDYECAGVQPPWMTASSAARATAAPSFLERYKWHLGIGAAALGVGYLLLRRK